MDEGLRKDFVGPYAKDGAIEISDLVPSGDQEHRGESDSGE
jgi:hypothetical protein